MVQRVISSTTKRLLLQYLVLSTLVSEEGMFCKRELSFFHCLCSYHLMSVVMERDLNRHWIGENMFDSIEWNYYWLLHTLMLLDPFLRQELHSPPCPRKKDN